MGRSKAKTMIEKMQEDLQDDKRRTATEVRSGWPPHAQAAVATAKAAAVPTTIEQWPLYVEVAGQKIPRLVPHPDNPRSVNVNSPKFRDLLESIKACGVREPLSARLLVDGKEQWRESLGKPVLELLSGHRRLKAAQLVGLETVPVLNYGVLPDAEAFDIVAMANLHEDLTPLEEGRRAATWLDKYGQDAKAVASKLGTTARWVLEHAQIERGLSAEWKAAAAAEERLSSWTAGHWAVIARLAPSGQAKIFSHFNNQRFWDCDRTGIKDLERLVHIELLYLAKAPFETGEGSKCHGCLNRSGRQPLLFADTVEEATGRKERCLDPACWTKLAAKAVRDEYKIKRDQLLEKHRVAGDKLRAAAVPISTMEEPEDWTGRDRYRKKIAEVKRSIKGLVESDRWTEAKEGDKGAVPGIVVAGKDNGTLKWVRIVEARKAESGSGRGRREAAADSAQRQAEESKRQRWQAVSRAVFGEMARAQRPGDAIVMLCCLGADAWPEVHIWSSGQHRLAAAWAELVNLTQGPAAASEAAFQAKLADLGWRAFVQHCRDRKTLAWGESEVEALRLIAPLFGIDLNQRYNALDKEKPKPEKPAKGGKRKGAGKKKTAPAAEPGVCPVQAGTGECVSDGHCQTCGRKAAALEAEAGEGSEHGDG